MLKWAVGFVLIVLLFSLRGFGQMSPDEAMDRLKERQADGAAAATQPSQLSIGEVTKMQALIDKLTAENQRLQEEVDDLQQQLAMAKAGPGGPNGFAGAKEPRVGMTMDDLKRLPEVKIVLLDETTTDARYRISTGLGYDYGTQQVQGLVSTHNQQVVTGTHAEEVVVVTINSASGKVTSVRVEKDATGNN